MPRGKHGNLTGKASQVYEALTREHPGWSKTRRAKIANAVKSHTVDHHTSGAKKKR